MATPLTDPTKESGLVSDVDKDGRSKAIVHPLTVLSHRSCVNSEV